MSLFLKACSVFHVTVAHSVMLIDVTLFILHVCYIFSVTRSDHIPGYSRVQQVKKCSCNVTVIVCLT
jgi:hypothetical protein